MNRRPGLRSIWTTTLRESAIFVLIERYGNSIPLCKTQLVKRARPCFAELAWIVDIWGEVPIRLIQHLDLRNGTYGFVGMGDKRM